jgi:major type 1 subunit fimbrin (pilin)
VSKTHHTTVTQEEFSMKKLIALSAASACLLAGWAQAQPSNGTATLNFSGALTAVTCTVSLASNSGFTTTLPTIPASQFTASGQTNGKTPFAVQVTGCSGNNSNGVAITSAVPYFDVSSPNIDQATGNLKNTFSASGGTTAATNVELQLVDAGTSGQVLLNQPWAGGAGSTLPTATQGQKVTPQTLSGGAATFNFYVQYIATSASPTVGSVTSSVPLIMQYN